MSRISKCQFQRKIKKKKHEEEFEECTNQIQFPDFQSVSSNEKLKRKITKRNLKNVQIKFTLCYFHQDRENQEKCFRAEATFPRDTPLDMPFLQNNIIPPRYLVVLLLVKTKSDIMRLYQRSFLTQFQCSGRYYLQTCLLSWIGWGNLVFFSPFGTEIRMPFVCVNHVLYA